MAATSEYFNLYVEYQSTESKGEDFYNTFAYAVLNENEIKQYIDLVKQKSWGEQAIGNRKLQVVPAHTIKVFDLSKVIQKGDSYNRDELLKMVPLNPDTEVTLLEQLERYGEDVTKEMFGEELQIFLNDLQLEIQIEQRGINAETGELGSFFSEENMKGQVKSGSSVEADLKDKVSPLFPKEFQERIVDNSIPPAFNVEKIASVFASHVKNLRDESGQMVGVFGQWGRGKSFFTKEVFKVLDGEVPTSFHTIKFQAWRYQQTPSIWAYLFETFIEEFLNVVWWKKAYRHFNLTISRQGHWKTWVWPLIGIIVSILAFSFTSKLVDDSERQIIIKILGAVGTLTISFHQGKAIMEKIKKPATTIFNSFSKAPSFKSVLGVQAEIEKELKHLLNAWSKYLDKKRILLFVDDLDRCNEEQIIDIIDSLRVILDDDEIKTQILILVALDEDKLKRAIIQKYKGLFTETVKLDEIVSEYMDKLFISAIKLFPITLDDRSEFVRKLAKQINSEDISEQDLQSEEEQTPTPRPTPTPTPTSTPTSTPTPEVRISSKNLDGIEITMLQEKTKTTNQELTPRQIRILIYRYLLARNLWLVFFNELDWKVGDAIDEIMRFSRFSKESAEAKTKVFAGLSNIARMVVAY